MMAYNNLMQMWRQVRYKFLELVLLLVVCGLLVLLRWAAVVIVSVAVALAGVLYAYDHPALWRSMRVLSLYALEIAFVMVMLLALLLWDVSSLTFILAGALGLAFVVALNHTAVMHAAPRAMLDIRTHRSESALWVIAVVLMLIWSFSLEAIIFLSGFLAFLLYRWESRIPAAGALLSLITCPILLALDMQTYAEQMAVYAYYFLVMTVLLQMADSWREGSREEYPGLT